MRGGGSVGAARGSLLGDGRRLSSGQVLRVCEGQLLHRLDQGEDRCVNVDLLASDKGIVLVYP